MLKIRLTRVGKRNKPQFRIVVAEHASPINGKFLEVLGSMDPYTKSVVLKEERIKHWLSVGAKPSTTVHNLFVDKKVIEGEKVKSWKPKKKENSGEEIKTEEKKSESES